MKRLAMLAVVLFGCSSLAQAQHCDPTLSKHVYNPQRLHTIKSCVTVTGIKKDATRGKMKDGCRREADGDFHCWLKLDPEFKNMVNEENVKNQDGNLVFEPMCQHKVTQADAIKACTNWKQNLLGAPIGSHIELTGTYVLDAQHGHTEIHPVTSIKIITH